MPAATCRADACWRFYESLENVSKRESDPTHTAGRGLLAGAEVSQRAPLLPVAHAQ